MNDERDPIQQTLRRLRLGQARPALRAKTLRAVGAALTASGPAPRRWWHEVRLELALAAGIAVCAALIPPLGRLPDELHTPPSPPAATPEEEALLEQLDLEDLTPYFRFRLDTARRHRNPTPREPYHAPQRALDLDER